MRRRFFVRVQRCSWSAWSGIICTYIGQVLLAHTLVRYYLHIHWSGIICTYIDQVLIAHTMIMYYFDNWRQFLWFLCSQVSRLTCFWKWVEEPDYFSCCWNFNVYTKLSALLFFIWNFLSGKIFNMVPVNVIFWAK